EWLYRDLVRVSCKGLELPGRFDREGEDFSIPAHVRRPETAHGGRFQVGYDGPLLSKAFHRLGLRSGTTSVVLLDKALQHG
ncbi:MAG: hypothetical protein ABSE84_33185, partial [Isosphaeraceae bacterium]